MQQGWNIDIQSHRPSSTTEAAVAISLCSLKKSPAISLKSNVQPPDPCPLLTWRPLFMLITKYVERLLVLMSILPLPQSFPIWPPLFSKLCYGRFRSWRSLWIWAISLGHIHADCYFENSDPSSKEGKDGGREKREGERKRKRRD